MLGELTNEDLLDILDHVFYWGDEEWGAAQFEHRTKSNGSTNNKEKDSK